MKNFKEKLNLLLYKNRLVFFVDEGNPLEMLKYNSFQLQPLDTLQTSITSDKNEIAFNKTDLLFCPTKIKIPPVISTIFLHTIYEIYITCYFSHIYMIKTKFKKTILP